MSLLGICAQFLRPWKKSLGMFPSICGEHLDVSTLPKQRIIQNKVRDVYARLAFCTFCLGLSSIAAAQASPPRACVAGGDQVLQGPDITEVLSVPQIGTPRVSHDGSAVLYSVTTPDWNANDFDTEFFLSTGNGPVVQATNTLGGPSSNAQWATGGDAFFYIADRGQGMQIYRAPVSGAEHDQVTAIPGGLLDFAVSPNGDELALLLAEAPAPELAARAAEMGRFTIVGEHRPSAHLWLLDIEAAIAEGGANPFDSKAVRRLTVGSGSSVTLFSEAGIRQNFSISPDGNEIAFAHAESAMILDTIRSNISVVDTRTGEIRPISFGVDWDETPVFSPDGEEILFGRTVISDWLDDKALMIVPSEGGQPQRLEFTFNDGVADTQPLLIGWSEQGIDAFFLDGVDRQVFRIDRETARVSRVTPQGLRVMEADFSADGNTVAFVGLDAETAPELYRVSLDALAAPERLSDVAAAMRNWPHHDVTITSWLADDDVRVEGVLYEPAGLTDADVAPLIIVLHGGPRDVEFPRRLHNQLYPVEQWLSQGARVLFPNYRGSTGYGAAFRQLIVGDIGRAETRDVVAAVESFVSSGLAAEDAIGIVGHSWGGYIAAFSMASTDLFSVASIGSGIIDNRVNYALSTVGVAEEGYLESLPWTSPDLWSAASPISYVTGDEAPTLIQHGTNDVVVPPANAQMLYAALTDLGAEARLVLFDDTGHYVSRPMELRTWMQQNLDWFATYLCLDCPENCSGAE